jgi:hypothetical protein
LRFAPSQPGPFDASLAIAASCHTIYDMINMNLVKKSNEIVVKSKGFVVNLQPGLVPVAHLPGDEPQGFPSPLVGLFFCPCHASWRLDVQDEGMAEPAPGRRGR